jgi:hypothetical protein
MNKRWRHIALGLLLALLAPGALAQRMGFSASAGIASQRMDDLKYLQQYILDTYPLEGKITSSFPPFTTGSFNLFKEWYDHIDVGGGYSFSTTGGKSSYSDHTGIISTEMIATSHRLGAFLSYSILGGERLELSLYGRVDVNLSSVSIESAVNVLGNINRLFLQYRAISPSGTAGLELMYDFSGFSVGMNGAYLVDFPGNLNDTDSDDQLTDPQDNDRILTADWTGWSVQIKTLIWLNF